MIVSMTTWAQAQGPGKIGVIHFQNALIATKDGQKAASELESKTAPKKKELEKKQGEIQSLRDQLSKTSSVGSEEVKAKLMRDIDTRTKQFNREIEDAQTELDQEQGRVLQELGGRMLSVIEKFARDNGYSLIIDISSQQTPVLFAANTIEVTKEVVDLYDRNAGGAAAPAPASGVAPAGAKPAGVAPAGAKPPATTAPKPPPAK